MLTHHDPCSGHCGRKESLVRRYLCYHAGAELLVQEIEPVWHLGRGSRREYQMRRATFVAPQLAANATVAVSVEASDVEASDDELWKTGLPHQPI